MRRILFTAANQEEIECAQHAFRLYENQLAENIKVDFMLTGIGTTSTCYRLTKKILEANFEKSPYTLIINIGIAGSFNISNLPIGTTIVIEKEYFGDLGFETMFEFQTLFQYELLDADVFPYKGGALYREKLEEPLENLLAKYDSVTGVTVQTVSGDPNRVEDMKKRFLPDIESMEGAAIYYVCLQEKISCFELRTVSNEVGERDKNKWNTPAALKSLTECCKEILNTVSH
ncbi:MAG: futalosine hydrolase [Bacteroidales bacterium]